MKLYVCSLVVLTYYMCTVATVRDVVLNFISIMQDKWPRMLFVHYGSIKLLIDRIKWKRKIIWSLCTQLDSYASLVTCLAGIW